MFTLVVVASQILHKDTRAHEKIAMFHAYAVGVVVSILLVTYSIMYKVRPFCGCVCVHACVRACVRARVRACVRALRVGGVVALALDGVG